MRLERSWNNEAEVWPDHIHILVSILPKLRVSGFMRCLGSKSSILIYQNYSNMKFKYLIGNFGVEGIM